jgi:hypothetical protein
MFRALNMILAGLQTLTACARCACLQLIGRDLELVTVRITKVNRVRNLVILELNFDSPCLQFALCGEKIFPIRAKRQVEQPDLATG